MTLKNIVITAIVAIIASVAVFVVFAPSPLPGATSGPVRNISDFYCDNGVCHFPVRKPLVQATTTVCSIKSPSATSTLVTGGIHESTSSTTASVLQATKALTAFSSTTNAWQLASSTVAANTQGYLNTMATQTANLLDVQTNRVDLVFGPNQFLNFTQQGGLGTFSPVGWCYADFVTGQAM